MTNPGSDPSTSSGQALARQRWDNAPTVAKTCASCGSPFNTKFPERALYCPGGTCKKREQRRRRREKKQ